MYDLIGISRTQAVHVTTFEEDSRGQKYFVDVSLSDIVVVCNEKSSCSCSLFTYPIAIITYEILL